MARILTRRGSKRRIPLTAGALVLGLAVALAVITEAYTTFGKWSSASVVYYINPSNQDVTATMAEAAVRAGASAWTQQSGANFQFVYGGRVSATTTGYDLRNVVLFRNASNGGTIATTYYWTSLGLLLDADIIFWDGAWTFFAGSSGCSGGAYIQDVATHEFGHALGLKHSSVTGATMYPSYTQCSTQMRSLAADDIAGVQKLYPPTGTNTAPVVAISKPVSNTTVAQGTAITFAGSATDKEDGNLTAALAWTSSLEGPLGGGGSFSRVLSAGTHIIKASVSDSRGLTGSKQVTITVAALANSAPSVTISSPSNNATFAEGKAIPFAGSASDPEDGTLTSKLTWRSNLDGALGTGGSFSKVLRVGTHVIEAAVRDSGGLSTSRKIGITVASNALQPSSILLSATGSKVKGSLYAHLKWAGATSAKVDVYRNNVRVATTANDGAHVDAVGRKGGGSVTYKVCAAGTSTCSKSVVVTF
jgi:hypothetical protein